MHALALERVEVARQGGDQGLAFTGLHFGDVAPVQGGAAHKLHVEVTLAEGALGHLAYGGEGLRHQLVQAFAVVDALLELGGLALEILIAECSDLVLQRVHGLGHALELLDLAAFAHTQGFVDDIYHVLLLLVVYRKRA